MVARAHSFAAGFVGEIAVGPDGVASGWCRDPARPGLRCVVEIMAEDRLAATVPARDARADLLERGFPDMAHGFRAILPPAALPGRAEVLVWARVAGARRGFAQCLFQRRGVADETDPREAALAAAIADISDRLSAFAARPAAPPAMAAFAAPQNVEFPFVRRPAVTLVVPLPADPRAALRRLAAISPLARAEAAEVLAVDASEGLAPVPNLRLIRGSPDLPRAIAGHARGGVVAVLDPHDRAASMTALAHALRKGPSALFGPDAPASLPAWDFPASPGIRAILPRAAFDTEGGWAGILARARAGNPFRVRVG